MNFDAWLDVCNKTKGYILNSEAIYAQSVRLIKDFQKEYFIGLYLNCNDRLIASEIIAIGSASYMISTPTEVFRPAIIHSASSVIVAHNHTDCHSKSKVVPSKGDDITTKIIIAAGKCLKIKLVDHLIIGNNRYYSYRDEKRFGLK